jgi:hypothetical protein
MSGQNDFIALFEGNDRLFPIRGLASLGGTLAAKFTANIQSVYAGDFDLEQFLDRLADLGLICARIGDNRVLIVFLALARPFFSKANSSDDFESFHDDWESVIGIETDHRLFF